MTTALLLDLDDTLIDDRGAMADAVRIFRRQHGLVPQLDDDTLIAAWDRVTREQWARLEGTPPAGGAGMPPAAGRAADGRQTLVESRRQRLRLVFELTLGDAQADDLFQDYIAAYERSWRLLPGAEAFLAATDHLPRALVTNGYGPQAGKKLRQVGLAGRFQAVLTPESCGARKPDPRMFTQALQHLGAVPQHTLMVGDNAVADIAPALALGLRAFHVDARVPGRGIVDALAVLQPR